MAELAMVMPMAGRGSRFARGGVSQPKPLVDLAGRPFFWWATESLRRVVPLREMVFVVLEEHVQAHAIDRRVRDFYPDARIVAIPDVTSGAAETAKIGLEALAHSEPVALNDCDHAFRCPELVEMTRQLEEGLDGALLCFPSANPAYSYAEMDAGGRVAATVEKQVVSPYAIAGCYLFGSPGTFLSAYEEYRERCPYDELFVSGIYNQLIAGGKQIGKVLAERHISFGTPEELSAVDSDAIQALFEEDRAVPPAS